MSSITVSTHVAAPIERVFDVYTDIRRAVERIPDITALEVLSEGPFGEGTRWRETRLMFKKEATEEMWVTNFSPLKSYNVEAESHGMRYSTLFQFIPDDAGVQVSWSFEGTPLTLGTKLMSPLLTFMMKGVMRKCMRRDLEALREVAEAMEKTAMAE